MPCFFYAEKRHVSGRLFSSSPPALSRQYSWHFAAVEELSSPIRPVRACTSTELSAFRSPEWSFSTALFGSVSSGTVWRPPGSVPGRTIRSVLLPSSVHLAFQSCSIFGFSRSSYCSTGCPIHFSTHCLLAEAGVSGACLCPRLILSCALIVRSDIELILLR